MDDAVLACIEVGGSSTQTGLFRVDDSASTTLVEVVAGASQPAGARLALAVPGWVEGQRVVAASNLDWFDVDPVERLGLRGPAEVLRNDAEAAALGEAVLRGVDELVYVGLGTGVGGAAVTAGSVTAGNLFGHTGEFGKAVCRCGRRGCLEAVVGGWALPDELDFEDYRRIVDALAAAIDDEPEAQAELVVIGGGMTRRHPHLVHALRAALLGREVEESAAPDGTKSAAPFGLAHELLSIHA